MCRQVFSIALAKSENGWNLDFFWAALAVAHIDFVYADELNFISFGCYPTTAALYLREYCSVYCECADLVYANLKEVWKLICILYSIYTYS